MDNDLIRNINQYTKNLKGKRDSQVSRVYALENKLFKKEKLIFQVEASKIVRKLENHWKILITQIYPEYEGEYEGETWPINKKSAAVNISANGLYPYMVIHEVSHGITECCTMFHEKRIKEPGHGPFWCGVYAYNLNYILNYDITCKFDQHKIRYVDRGVIEDFRQYFKTT